MERTGGGHKSKSNDSFIDRSKVRILLCDNDAKSSEEVLALLCKCSYQVTPVKSARQVIDALNADGPDIDIILAEVDLPMAKGMKMLKYITRDNNLRRIPVIMMSAQDEVSVVVKCLRLGAADYLVKPLRTNELLNLWTHMWRRRRMLGLAEKNMLSYDFDLLGSDHSDANTNSTTIFSDDTDDKSRRSANPEIGMSIHPEDETNAAAATTAGPPVMNSFECRPNVPAINDRQTGQFCSGPKKSELKVGESSAFFTYIKSSILKNNPHGGVAHNGKNTSQPSRTEQIIQSWSEKSNNNIQVHEPGEALENNFPGDDFPSSNSKERSCTPPLGGSLQKEEFSHPINESQVDFPGFLPHSAYPYYIPGVMNQVMISSSGQFYPPGMASFPYYHHPVSMCPQPGQVSNTHHSWPSLGHGSSSTEVNLSKVDRREAALIKFRQKRKERCFDKKIRYANRKRLAERRPRVRGQFVRKVNGVTVDLNGNPASIDFDEDEEDDEE